MRLFIEEFEAGESNESILAQDADCLELVFFLKEEHDLGNPRALGWFANALKRLHTPVALTLAQELQTGKADDWWKMRIARKEK